MKSSDAYKFTLSWQKDTEEQILAGEFLNKLGHRKSKFIVQLICEYIAAHPEAINPKETLQFIINSTSLGETMSEFIKSIIQSELAGKTVMQQSSGDSASETTEPEADADIGDMLGNLDTWN
jgi:hypothetical protein